MSDRFPEVPRQEVRPGFDPNTGRYSLASPDAEHNVEPLEIGEIVECKLQKADWCRCKITLVRVTNMYDIKYDTGEELRFVKQEQLRLRPEKREYAYRVVSGL